MTPAELLAKHGIKLESTQPGRYYTTCPECSSKRQRGNQSRKVLGVTIDEKGVRWGCSHCGWSGPKKGSGSNGRAGDNLTTYDYRNTDGAVQFQKVRAVDKNGKKLFWMRRPDGNGGWINGTKGVDTTLLYRLPDVIEAIALDRTILVVEGEKDTDALWAIGIPATCNAHGASEPDKAPKWVSAHSEQLRGADIVIIPDHDPSGYAHAAATASLSHGIAKRVRMLDLAKHWPDIPSGGDISDWLAVGHTREQLDALIATAPDDEPQPASQSAPDVPVFDPWQRHIVPAFPFGILPPIVEDFVGSQSEVIGCCPSALAMCALGAFSGALSHGFRLKLLRNGTWLASPRLWILGVGDVSVKKTPMFETVSRPLVQYEAHLRDLYRHALREYERAKESDSSKMQEPEPPPRYLCWDTTTEKLGEILARNNDKGVLVLTDEVSGWLGSMERYNSSGGRADRAFWLSAYDGGPRTVDRIKRGELFIPNLSASVMGGIQPARLAEIQGLTSDGLLQRFLPVMVGPAKFRIDRPSPDDDYAGLVRQMIFAKPQRLIMTDDALASMTELHQHLFRLEQGCEGLSPGLQSFVGKLHGVTGSLALILHLAHGPQTAAFEPVEVHTVAGVRRLVIDFILPHAYEFYQAGTAEGERLRRLASWVLTSGKERILASDLTSGIGDFRGLTLPEVHERVSPLVAAGWLQPADFTPVCRSWQVNPQVYVQLAERAKIEAERKAALGELMGAPWARSDR